MPTSFRLITLFHLILLSATLLLATPSHAQDASHPLGEVKPMRRYPQTVIAIPAFGKDSSIAVDFETMPRVIRRDLELTGFFKIADNQQAINSQNVKDVAGRGLDFDAWAKMGVQHLLMGNIVPSTGSGKIKAHLIFWDVESRKLIFNRDIEGNLDDVRMLAHRISDEVVLYSKGFDGFAQAKLTYITEQIPGIKEVALMDSDAFNQRPLTNFGKLCTTPTWGANGAEIYYTSYHGNRANVYGQLLSTGKTWTIAAYGGTNHSPEWSPEAGKIVMVLSKDGNSELYTCGRDGNSAQRLTKTKATDGSPTWSPDGKQIAFASDEADGIQIFVMNADGSGKRRISNGLGPWNDAPAWSPDGRKIAFVARIGGKSDIFTVNADGSKSSIARITQGQGNNESPSWAPNSHHLAFASDRTGSWQIYLSMDDGFNQRQLTTTGRNTQPEWSPMPKQ